MPDYQNLELKELNYNSYLKVPELLSLQHELSQTAAPRRDVFHHHPSGRRALVQADAP